MTTPRTVTNAMHKGDWAVSIDLKDAYFHVPIHVRSRRLLRFAIATNDGLRVFEFRALPFGLTSAPPGVYQGNSSVGAPCASACRLPSSVSQRLATEKSKQDTVGSANKLVARYHSSGGVCTKCGQVTTNTHATSDTHRGGISSRPRSDVPSDDTSSKVRGQDIDIYVSADHDSLLFPVAPRTSELSNRCNPSRQVASQTSAAVFAKSLGTGLKGPQGPDPSEAQPVGPSPSVVVGQEVHQSGMLLDIPEAQTHLFTDASESGWGAHLDKHQVSGSWSTREATLHINHLEMLAGLHALRAFRVQLKGLTVQLMSDNASVVSYIRKQGEQCLCLCTFSLGRY